jgi:alanine-synthesizing transaminase
MTLEDLYRSLHQHKLKNIEAGVSICDLSMINPDLPPARKLLDLLTEATVKPSNHRYAVSRGLKRLREAFATKYRESFAVSLDSEENVCVTLGTKDAIFQLCVALDQPGASVLIGRPTYQPYRYAAKYARLQTRYFTISNNESEMIAEIRHRCEDRFLKLPSSLIS